MPKTACNSCKRVFKTEHRFLQHLEGRSGLTCNQALTLQKGNGNVFPLTLGDGIGGPLNELDAEQERRARQRATHRISHANLLGPYTNANMLRLKVEYGWSEKEYNDVISTVMDPRWNSSDITAVNKNAMYFEIDRAIVPIMNTEGMIQKHFTLAGQNYNFYVVKDLPYEAVLMLTNPRMRGSIHYTSERKYVIGHEGDENYRVYNEPWTGNFWHAEEEKLRQKFGPDIKYVAIIIHIDGTVVVGFGKGSQKTYVTVSMTLANFTPVARSAKLKLSGNRIPVCYLPTLIKDPKSNAANFQNERLLNQLCLESLFSGLLHNDGYGSVYNVCDADGSCQRVCPGLFVINQDLAEFYKRFLMVSGTCPCCMCPKESLANCEDLFPPRKSCADVLSIWNATTTKTQRKIVMHAEGLKELPFWGWQHTQLNVYKLFAFDELHVIDKTVAGDDLFMRCLTGALMGGGLGAVDGNNEAQGLTRAQMVAHLQARDQAIQNLPYYQFTDSTHHTKYFYKGIRLGDDSDAKWALGSTIFMEGNRTSFFQSIILSYSPTLSPPAPAPPTHTLYSFSHSPSARPLLIPLSFSNWYAPLFLLIIVLVLFLFLAWAHAQLFRAAIHYLFNGLLPVPASDKYKHADYVILRQAQDVWNSAITNLTIWRELVKVKDMPECLLKVLDKHYIIFLSCMQYVLKILDSPVNLNTVKFHLPMCMFQ